MIIINVIPVISTHPYGSQNRSTSSWFVPLDEDFGVGHKVPEASDCQQATVSALKGVTMRGSCSVDVRAAMLKRPDSNPRLTQGHMLHGRDHVEDCKGWRVPDCCHHAHVTHSE
ncbi:hypothetical protein CBOM_05631 [Ceraceosorus bombacis]|uniref:Uncharacterized protein n=1 Tax=Ceraceosorus bombacis TaxID=401625 RepID=A0A0P1BQM7_9BASI|nr:hypothetical protein CBOM_05631 [Ceraceosorus bombacis]